MRSFFINPFTAIGLGAAIGLSAVVGIHAVTARLEHSAAMQCRQQDWPVEKHAAMTEWCREFEATRQAFGRY